MDPVILASARQRGVNDGQILYAYRNPIRAFEVDDMTMLIGADKAARVFEVGVATAEGIDVVVHVLVVRPRFLD